MRITLDWPSNKLSPNARGHWAVKAKETKLAKNSAFWITEATMREAGMSGVAGPVDVLMVFHPRTHHAFDLDNLQARMKASLDGIALALGIDDVHFRPVSQMGARKSRGAVVVTLTPAVVEIPVRGAIS